MEMGRGRGYDWCFTSGGHCWSAARNNRPMIEFTWFETSSAEERGLMFGENWIPSVTPVLLDVLGNKNPCCYSKGTGPRMPFIMSH
jgi:hypothetical protein